MAKRRFEVTLRKVECVRVVVEAADAASAQAAALEMERRGEADAAFDRSVTAVAVADLSCIQ